MSRKKATELYDRAEKLKALKYGHFTLASGITSSYYFDGRLLSLDPDCCNIITELFMKQIVISKANAFGGPAIAAIPIVGSLVLKSSLEGLNLTGFFVRGEKKAHGTAQQIEGSIKPGMKIAVFDDTISTRGSLLNAINAVEAFGCEVVLAMTILDRQQGGSDALKKRRIPLYKIWQASDLGKIEVKA